MIGYLVQRSAKRWPNRPAIVDEGGSVSFRQVSDRVFRLANALSALGLEPGDRVLDIQLGSRTYVEADLACGVAGLVRVPVDPRRTEREIAGIAEDSGAAAIIAGAEFGELAGRLPDDVASIRHVVAVAGADGAHDYEELVRSASASTAWRRATGGLSSINYSSGTMGAPKGCLWTVRSRIASAHATLTSITGVLGAEDAFLHPGPTGHAADIFTLPYFVSGAKQVLTRAFDAEQLPVLAREHGITCTALGPTMLEQLVDALDGASLGRLSTIAYTGAPIAPDRLARCTEVLGHRLVQYYGSAEAIPPLTVLTAADHGEPGLLASAGLPVPGVALRLEADDSGSGELLVGGDHIMRAYWSNKDAANRSIHQGWVRTGDIATVDDRGYVYVLDRLADTIISGGLSVVPSKVERALDAHPGVRESSVVGVLDSDRGESIVAFVVASGGRDGLEQDLRRLCAGKLAGHEAPGRYEFVQELPRSAAGKVLRKVLRARAGQASATR